MRALRPSFAFLAAAVLAAAAVPAAAQDTDMPGCTQANPCEVIVDLDANGIDVQRTEFTRGDWILLSVFNDDDQEHTLTVEGKGISLTLAAGDINDTRPFELSSIGKVTLKDSPSGDTADLTVGAEESFSSGASSGSGKGSPGLAPLAIVGALVAVAAALRRRA
jgi:hypothetical protein